MARLILVRHGRAARGWEETDPALDEVGRAQATAVAEVLAPLGPLPLLSSPLRRCQQTAAPLAAAWGTAPVIEPAVAELPSPEGVATAERPGWLRGVVGGTWADLPEPFRLYRAEVLACLAAIGTDTVVVSHFIAINAAVGAALGDNRLVVLHLDNCSRTILDNGDDRFTLVEGGAEADTLIR